MGCTWPSCRCAASTRSTTRTPSTCRSRSAAARTWSRWPRPRRRRSGRVPGAARLTRRARRTRTSAASPEPPAGWTPTGWRRAWSRPRRRGPLLRPAGRQGRPGLAARPGRAACSARARADPYDDGPRPVLERFDLRKREVTDAGRRAGLVRGQRRRHPAGGLRRRRAAGACRRERKHRATTSETVTVDLSRARFLADPAALWRHAYAEAGRIMRRDFWVPDMAGDRLGRRAGGLPAAAGPDPRCRRTSPTCSGRYFGETGTSHAYVVAANGSGARRRAVRRPAGRRPVA